MPDLASDLSFVSAPGVFAPGHLGELTQVVPFEMIDEVLTDQGGGEQRVRRLPSRVVVYLLLAGGLFEHLGWAQVWARLTASLSGSHPVPAGASLTEAMRRVGIGPVKALFDVLKGSAATTARQSAWFAGRLLVAIDGTQIAVPDSAANLVAFPKPVAGPNGPVGYPMLRLVAVVACGTRTVIEAVFGTDKVGELTYAARLTATGALHAGMLLLADRNFATYAFLAQVAATGSDLLVRAKTGGNAMKLPATRHLADGSFLTRAGQVTIRVIDAQVTATTADGVVQAGTYRLLTTLLDPHEAPALALVRLYHQRWEIETSYAELKSTMLGGRVLRARHPAAVVQETWALLAGYQALRTAMADAVLARPDVDPDRASFTIALNTARDQVIRAAGIITDTVIDLVGPIGTAVLDALLPPPRPRIRARIIKRAISKYQARNRHADRRSRPVTITTTLLTPRPGP
ncbi:IS4 family transposase [Promicromonospora citrea]|uniref:IS4 family transposase n=2 Tax=Promicromonospora citrea TaxID=43677 RepID=UPI001858CA6F|nr:IS4 family transposase [Promicromonospora citrea]NNH55207.1 IS4 family transposase [Promicromonospora citrea]